MTPKIPVSVVIISKNEARAIERCVRSVSAYDQIFVVDSHSEDETAQISKDAGAEVVTFTWNGQYPKKKQWALDNLPLRHDWVLYLDGDEYSTPAFDAEVRNILSQPAAQAYDVALDYVFLGRMLRHGHKVYKRVLFDRRVCAWPVLDDLNVDNPFEMELHVQPRVKGMVGRTENPIVHDDLELLSHYFDRHNRYSDWEAVLRMDGSNMSAVERTSRGKLWARVPFKPFTFFVYAYVAKQGFRDGRAGFHYAIANSFYYWQISVKTSQISLAQS